MALKMRLRKQGRTNRPFYRLVVTDTQNKRDGKYVECIGWYNPVSSDEDQILMVKPERAQHWVEQGVEVSPKAEALLRRAAPSVMKERTQREVAKKAKRRLKRKARRQKQTAVAGD